MRNGDFSRYYNINSPIHNLNPLCKILGLILFVVMVLLCSRVKVIISLFLILMFVITISNVPLKNYFSLVYKLRFLIIFIFIINFLFGDFYHSFVIVSKIILVVMYYFVFIFTTTTNSVAYGVSSFLRPFSFLGFSVFHVSMKIALFLSFFPSLFISSGKIKRSQLSRGFDFVNCSISDRIHYIKFVFISSYRRFNGNYKFMEVRSFSDDSSSIASYRWRFNDFYMICCHLILFVLVLVKEVVV